MALPIVLMIRLMTLVVEMIAKSSNCLKRASLI